MEADGSLVGRTLGKRFRIEKCIGRGGMATVYAARVESGDRAGTAIALKVVNRELTRDPMVLKRFDREAKSASRLQHRNTVEVYEYGVDGADAYIAMELAQGQDLLHALAAENPMRQARASLIVAQICAGLSAAHGQGIIHRDLKPENVMLVPDPSEPGGERVKVLDFGIAKIVDSPTNSGAESDDGPPSYVTKTALTRVGTIVGTPAYMSPEQCRGGEVDARSDVYACGVLLYQILTGEVPFTGETPLHTAMRHIHAQPKPPRQLRSSLAPELEKIVLKALAKWPGERHQTADQMRDELLAVIPKLPDAQGIELAPKPKPSVVIPGPAKPEAGVDPTELVIPTDPRMENGALGAGKLGMVRLSSQGAPQAPRPGAPLKVPIAPPKPAPANAPSAGSPAARPGTTKTEPSTPPPAVPRPGLVRPPPKEGPRTGRPPAPLIAHHEVAAVSSAETKAVPRTADATAQTGGGRSSTIRGGYAPDKANEPSTDDQSAEEPTTPEKQGMEVKAAAQPNSLPASSITQPDARPAPARGPTGARPARPTETGFTPTGQIERNRVAAIERASLEDDDDDEPQTFVREAPTPPRGNTVQGQSFADDDQRPQHPTLVMEEGHVAGPAPHTAQPANLPRTMESRIDPSTRAHLDAAYDESLARERQAKQSGEHPAYGAEVPVAQMATGPYQPLNIPIAPTRPSQQQPFARPDQMQHLAHAPTQLPPLAPGQIADANPASVRRGPDGQFMGVKSTMRMSAEAGRAAAYAAANASSLNQISPTGLRGKLEQLSGTTLLLIGVAVGLFLALIGLLILIIVR
jgi:eukaryotic-like serine/threonine-protein kinase